MSQTSPSSIIYLWLLPKPDSVFLRRRLQISCIAPLCHSLLLYWYCMFCHIQTPLHSMNKGHLPCPAHSRWVANAYWLIIVLLGFCALVCHLPFEYKTINYYADIMEEEKKWSILETSVVRVPSPISLNN